jgi:hypothetical protein
LLDEASQAIQKLDSLDAKTFKNRNNHELRSLVSKIVKPNPSYDSYESFSSWRIKARERIKVGKSILEYADYCSQITVKFDDIRNKLEDLISKLTRAAG